jgi:hypothetical protein
MLLPMSDVPATVWWLAAIALALAGSDGAAIAAGLAASIAILTRPNIVPLILPVTLFLAVGQPPLRGTWIRRVVLFVAGCGPGILTVAAANEILYGSPAGSGYGTVSGIYHMAGAAGTAWQYLVWLWDTHSIYVFIPFLLPVLAVRAGLIARPLQWFCWSALAFFAVNLACYMMYIRFDHWTFLRFLLPSIPLLIVTATVLVTQALQGVSRASRVAVLTLVAAMFPLAYVHTAAKGDAFHLKSGLRHRFEDAATLAAAQLPPNAAFLALSQSGSLRHYADRLTLRFDWVEAAHADELAGYLRFRHLVPYAALDRSEITEFNTRFAGTAIARAAAAAPRHSLPPDGDVVFFPLDSDGPGLDHIPIAVNDLDRASTDYRALGFALKPGRPHDNGITNQHVKFRDGTELELITAPDARDALTATYRKHLSAGEGPAFLALFAPGVDAAALGLDADPLKYIFMSGRNQSPTDRPEHFAHANTAESLIGVWLAGDDLSPERRLLEKIGARIQSEDVRVPEAISAQVAHLAEGEVVLLPGARQLVPGRRIIGATVRVRDLAAARRVLADRGRTIGSSIFLPPDVTHGLWLELREIGHDRVDVRLPDPQ